MIPGSHPNTVRSTTTPNSLTRWRLRPPHSRKVRYTLSGGQNGSTSSTAAAEKGS